MKKILFTFLLCFLSFIAKAQLDTEHWFAPMYDRNSANNYYSDRSSQYIFLSTNETTPFDVEIYSGNIHIATIRNLSKGNPQNYFIAQKHIISRKLEELGKTSEKGLYLKASKKFFANLRFSTYNHAEILTSKGKAGIGTKFYAVMAPISYSADILNFTIGILATENNTKIKVSGYDPQVRFTNINPTPASIEITLNKGESYILEGDSYNKNRRGAIGTKIESDKPISITNGNFNGQYANVTRNSDIIMDQSVPVERLGNEFAIIKGNGAIGSNMEGAIIVATEDNTEVYVNNETTPIVVLNEGDYYVVRDNKFVNKGNGHYNLYVKSTKNIYLYQLLGGISGYYATATAGFNYIPPLNCFLPHQVGEIGLINTMYGDGNDGGYHTVPTKLNFITMRGATVNVDNYTLTAANGPFDVAGTSEWVTYSIPNVKGNINITSTKPITAGISAGDGAVGYGGYFAGFSTVVSIKKKGECIPNITLEVEGNYDIYQWRKNGVDIAGATSNTYVPTEAGNYSVRVGNTGCFQTTAETTVLNCTVETEINETICGVKVFTPVFSKSQQTIDLSQLKIVKQPVKGKVSIESTGKIVYTPNAGETGNDTFSYQFSGNDPLFPDTELVTVNLVLGKINLNDATLTVCPNNGVGIFDLTSANIGDITGYTIKYYPTIEDSEKGTNEITNPSSYSSKEGKVYIRAVSKDGCAGTVGVDLKFHSSPKVNVSQYISEHCDADFDGKIEVNFSEVTGAITEAHNTTNYYLSFTDAEAGNTNYLPNNWSYAADTDVFVRVISKEGCAVVDKISFKLKERISLLTKTHKEIICDTDSDAKKEIDLADFLHKFTTNTTLTATYYTSLQDAKNQVNAIDSKRNVSNGETYYIRFDGNGSCANIGELEFDIKIPLHKTVLKACPNNGVGIFDLTSANIGNVNNYRLKYYPTETDRLNDTNEIANPSAYSSSGGIVYVKVDTDRVCKDTGEISLELYSTPTVNVNNYKSMHCDANFDGKIEVNFSEVTAAITDAHNTAKYYLSRTDADAGNNNHLPNNWSYAADTDVFVRVVSNEGCAVVDKIKFGIKGKLRLDKTAEEVSLCDTDFDGVIKVNLSDYHHLFTSDAVSGTYYATLSDAQKALNPLSEINVMNGQTYFLRLENSLACPNIASIKFNVNIPQHSSTLMDTDVCPTDTTLLDAGAGFKSYKWSTGEQSQSIIAGVGEYWVDLVSANGCSYRQYVKVNAIETPKIESIDIKDNTAVVNVVGGTAPYEYSLNGGAWQSSNVFTDLVKGNKYRVAVRSKNGCEPVYQDFSIIKLVNLITPNGDGINDVIDYSDLRLKANAKFNIYDRYGALVFEGNSANQFIWDGKAKGRPLPTASYWYLIEWQEPNTNTWVKTASWILLKNRD